ncbi:Stp1/IreP family PP2C-type Ser/Thr phosphatase [Anaeromyxobacter dehalogenans]|uniref:Stp1/IreP family PP2C-type Ser/Thr phosphatase n=1 Tax=Anaeromyxobacter dehalogenans TaxID=161493 RepID=UPI00059E070F|nr:Stp1/IreP family PP2C-type Ser/Thr phosphatase [Anaeromyxobacter dehalogenans]
MASALTPQSAERYAPRVAATPVLTIAAHGVTDVGRRRDHNEDAFLVDPALGLYVVADGMGGHAGGGTASRLAVETIQESVRAARDGSPEVFEGANGVEDSRLPDLLREAVEAACARIFQTAQGDPGLAGMGTTVTAALIDGRVAFVAHVGDSRCYLLREGRIYQVSEDHSLVNEQLKAGTISADEAKHSRFKNIITRSVGFEAQVQVDLMGIELEGGDALVICCDGLSNLVDDDEILQIVDECPIDEAPARLVALANDRGGDDNITVIVIRAGLAPVMVG